MPDKVSPTNTSKDECVSRDEKPIGQLLSRERRCRLPAQYLFRPFKNVMQVQEMYG